MRIIRKEFRTRITISRISISEYPGLDHRIHHVVSESASPGVAKLVQLWFRPGPRAVPHKCHHSRQIGRSAYPKRGTNGGTLTLVAVFALSRLGSR
jgi:hypothetical protein